MAETEPAQTRAATPFERKLLARQRPSDALWRDVLGDELRRQRHGRKETLGETADRAGISPQYLSEIERGLKEPSSEMIAAVAGALDVTLLDLTLAVGDVLRAADPAASRAPLRAGVLALAA